LAISNANREIEEQLSPFGIVLRKGEPMSRELEIFPEEAQGASELVESSTCSAK
jgi:hypothetical protein